MVLMGPFLSAQSYHSCLCRYLQSLQLHIKTTIAIYPVDIQRGLEKKKIVQLKHLR